jgi:hypothetical protein
MSLFFSLTLVASVGMVAFVVCDRPIYNIAHMVNAVKQIDQWLNYGANALEVDVTFSKYGTPKYFYHGTPCDVGRDCLRWAYVGNYINAIRERTNPGSSKFNSNLVLIMFDVKIKKEWGWWTSRRSWGRNDFNKAGEKFADTVLIPLYKNNPTKMKVIVSVPELSQKDFITGVLQQLKVKQPATEKKIGFDISFEKELKKSSEKEKVLEQLGVAPGHAWLSSGITNWLPDLYLKELTAQGRYRDTEKYFSKVYAWTLDKQSTAETYLNVNVDGVIANYPSRVKKAIEEVNKKREAGNKVRLATLDDDPFKVY